MRVVRMYGPIGDTSGYGNAVKNFAEAFSRSDVPVIYKFQTSKMKYVKNFKQYNGPANTDFYLHCPPYSRHKSNNYKIGYFYWEADRLPRHWLKSLNTLNEVWVPCSLVERACRNSGYKGTIKIVPTPMREFSLDIEMGVPSYFSNDYMLSDDVYKFYSIFQWHERKGYKELLKSYLSEFTPDDNVILILKVNPLNIKNYTEDKIKKDILRIKSYIKKKEYPPIFLSSKLVPANQIHALHKMGDCYVSPHHGEGWGMPIHDAMYAGNQIITTKYGGVAEYLSNSSAHLINYDLKPVTGMEWSSLYSTAQRWAYPNEKHLAYLMRDVYNNHKRYKQKAVNAQEIAKSMNIDSVAKILNKNLK